MNHCKFAVSFLAAVLGACAQLEITEPATPTATVVHSSTLDTEPELEVPEILAPNDIWHRLGGKFTLPREIERPKVQEYIRYFSSNGDYMTRVTQRSQRYIFHITEHLERAGLPLELTLLPIIESAFDPFAHSHANASGLWQFIPVTGRSFGLQQNWWYDGRRDIEASTRAATEYFRYLSTRFEHDWLLVLAAYNAGEGRVRRAIARNRKQGLGTSFWDLQLPRETRSYVPKLLALAEVVARREHYQTPLHEVANAPYYQAVDVGSQIDLAQAAELADIKIEELYLLNPAYNRWATDPNGQHQLLLPVTKHEKFVAELSKLPIDQRVSWQRYNIVRGDSLSTIAQRYKISVQAIREANKLPSNTIRAGQNLLIPSASKPAAQYAYAIDQRIKSRRTPTTGKKHTYTVRPGDTLWDIARDLNVQVQQLARWNNMATNDTLRSGKQLVTYASSNNNNSQPTSNTTSRKLTYRVRGGDSLYRIARKFSLTINDILRWNKISTQRYLQPGQQLTLFVDNAYRG